MADATYGPKVYNKQGGDELIIASGGAINIEAGGVFKVDGTQPAALTAALATITIADAAGTPDYALQAVINTNAWGFASQQEAISALYVIKNLQERVAELEARCESLGMITAN